MTIELFKFGNIFASSEQKLKLNYVAKNISVNVETIMKTGRKGILGLHDKFIELNKASVTIY